MQMCVVASLESRSARRSLGRWRNPPKRGTYWPDGDKMQARCLAGDVASTGGAEDAEGYYRDALVLAEPRGMRPLVAHCHLGLGKLYRRTGQREQAQEHLTTATTMYREMGMTYWLEKAEAELTA